MSKYRSQLPQLSGQPFLTDGGLETTLIFLEGLQLPEFASFHRLKSEGGSDSLRKYFRAYAEMARRYKSGFVLESATWRASRDWGSKLGYSEEALAAANRQLIEMLEDVREEYATDTAPMVISGCLGPRGDGYVPNSAMSAAEAETYHRAQVETLAATHADMLSAMTLNYVEEAIGVVNAAKRAGMPITISFTVETDGNLPTGQSLSSAIYQVDDATGGYPVYYMLNCAHPSHFDSVLREGDPWLARIQGLRANSSRKSHQELNDSTELDIGNPRELGGDYAALLDRLPRLNVLGGCCGTDTRHVEEIAKQCLPRLKKRTAR